MRKLLEKHGNNHIDLSAQSLTDCFAIGSALWTYQQEYNQLSGRG